MALLRVLPLLLVVGLVAGCKSNSRTTYQGEGRLIAEGPAREVRAAPGGGAVAWLADPQLARDKGANVSDQIYVGTARVAAATGGPATTLGKGVVTLPGTFFFSPTGAHVGALTDWSFPRSRGTLVLADVKGGEARRVAEDVTYFAFSPDGENVGYVSGRTLFVQRTAGSEPVEIAPNVSTLEFSPDGRTLAVRRRAVGGGGELLLVELAQPGKKQVLADEVADYRWSADGERLAYTARNEQRGSDLFVVQVGGKPKLVGKGVPTFQFSPDGKHLAFLGDVTPQKQFGDLYLLPASGEAVKLGTTVTSFQFAPASNRIGWLDKYSAQSRGGDLAWADLKEKAEIQPVARNVPSFTWSHDGEKLAFAHRQTTPVFSIDLHVFRIGEDEKSVQIGRGVFGYSFSADDARVFFRTECTRNARSCDLHAIPVATPEVPARQLATGIFTYAPDPNDESLLMITYARTDADALDVAAVPADGSHGPRTLDRMVAHGTEFVGGDEDRITYAVLDPKRLGVYVADAPDFEAPLKTE